MNTVAVYKKQKAHHFQAEGTNCQNLKSLTRAEYREVWAAVVAPPLIPSVSPSLLVAPTALTYEVSGRFLKHSERPLLWITLSSMNNV